MNKENIRKDRKKEHIEEYLKSTYENTSLFEDVYIENNSLPELNFDEIEMGIRFLGKDIDYPVMLNAITGGTSFSKEVNRKLSKIARKYNIPMALGSQTIALKDEESHSSFRVVREIMGDDGVVIGNLNAQASIEEARKAIDILDADGLQLHLNPAQELVMEEGDRDFAGLLENVESLVKNIDKPIIVKEVGFGISRDVAERLYDIGVRYIDISGRGGSNFIEIEARRHRGIDFTDMYSWGIPTAQSLIQCRNIRDDYRLISSGGIRTSMEVLKSLILGADIVAISGELLKHVVEGGIEQGDKYMGDLFYKLKILMLLTGSKDVEKVKNVPYKVTGKLKDLL